MNMNSYSETEAKVVLYNFINLSLFSIGHRHEIILGTLNLLFNIIFGRNVFYNRGYEFKDYGVAIVFTLIYCICFTLFSMLVIVIGEVNKKLRESTAQQIKLLNGMHEGLLIVSQDTH